ncbi:ABC transporter substrate-binding protein [Brevibacterium sp. 91QC2O2]|uniref:ABC transporter substrate-binding protein n=1 Tax=Brevibacterium sp. 91QC2O2 TaxID=2968458 RepID=UPI00211D03C4|nr:ABC transporter substrate-binding protein [Brevibacterium sp. 91QC2O2]MCQ9366726.1 ABC transporter substrate-binding protein [Brevibacterium sp. 91QC2O2]
MKIRAILAAAGTAVLALTLAACTPTDPLDSGGGPAGQRTAGSRTIVVGSQAYASNEIIAEIYAQALEGAGYTVSRRFDIGQRDAYWPSLQKGEIDVFPEYTGNLLQYLDTDAAARSAEDVIASLRRALPASLAALDYAEAADQDSYTVTADYAATHHLETIGDLRKVPDRVTLGGPAELEKRPYGPTGARGTYGLDLGFEATGETTVEALQAGTIQVGNVFTADPRIKTEGLVTLADPKSMFLSSNVVPIVKAELSDEMAQVLDPVDSALSTDELIGMNVANTDGAQQPAEIAKDWLSEKNAR